MNTIKNEHNEIITVDNQYIKSKIYTIRGVQVMIDSDIADLYGAETKYLNRAVKRNIERFPISFRFQLTEEELENWKSEIAASNHKTSLRYQNGTSKDNSLRFQNGILENEKSLRSQNAILNEPQNLRSQNSSSRSNHGGRRYLPYAFTEQGVAMLSAVLRSETAVKMSIQIMKAFVNMRHFLIENAQIFSRIERVEQKQIETDSKLEQIFSAIESKQIKPKQGIFFEGQIFDAYKLLTDIVKSAENSIYIIDNFIDETILTLLTKRKPKVDVKIFTKNITRQMQLDVKKYNKQYPKAELLQLDKAHDRFIVIDEKDVYHLGASLKDLGKKWFAFTKMNNDSIALIEQLKRKK